MFNIAIHFLYFIMYSMIGWCMEMAYCTILDTKKNKKFTMHNRGFLYGPLCPIYGTATTVMIIGLDSLQDNIPLMALVGIILCDTVEYFTSYIMEKLFHTRWWDYSDKFLNLHGRIDFNHSIQWGILSVVFVKYIHPFFSGVFSEFDEKQLEIIAAAVFLYFVYDLVNTIASTLSVRDLQAKMEKIRASFSNFAEDSALRRENIPQYSAEFKERLATIRESRRKRHLLIAFPEIMKLMEDEMEEIQSIPHEFIGDIEDIRRDITEFIDNHRPEMH